MYINTVDVCVCVCVRLANKVLKVHRNAINNERVSETIAEFIYDTFLLFFPHIHTASLLLSTTIVCLDCGRTKENAQCSLLIV